MRPALRSFSSSVVSRKTFRPATTTTPNNSRLRKPPPPSLEHFIQRQRVISLYRSIVRTLFKIPRSQRDKRDAMIAHARAEFDRNKEINDVTQIRYLISTGKTEFQGMERYIDELAHR